MIIKQKQTNKKLVKRVRKSRRVTKFKPWTPITNPADLKRLSKTGEESAELATVCFRTIAQGGLDELDPDTGISNRQSLEEEIADVIAQCKLTVKKYGLDETFILKRITKKTRNMKQWEAEL